VQFHEQLSLSPSHSVRKEKEEKEEKERKRKNSENIFF
jgi:hypothetical protein